MILDGKIIASEIYEELKKNIALSDTQPHLWAVLVGDDSVSLRYIRQKRKFAEKIGMHFTLFQFPENITEEELKWEIGKLNVSPDISGYIVQLPLPKHIDALRIIRNIDPRKDVDGFHPENQGKIMIWDATGFAPCTPAGIMKMLEYYNISLRWKKVTIIGRSNIVGKPLTQMCINAGASVSCLNSSTPDIREYTEISDIVVCATWQAHILKADMISSECRVIDVWFSVIDDKVLWDADYEAIIKQWNDITPVPGGVGPMTVATLLSNTYLAYKHSHEA